jgi:co-chaperonin GroES (HSP10)
METLRERHDILKLKTINNVKPINNYVVCKRLHHHFEDRTKGGLIRRAESTNRDQYISNNVERIFEVVKLPKELDEKGFWKTRIDVKVGDIVVVDYFDSLNSKVIKTKDEEEYRFILYYGIVAIIKKEKLVPINGFILFTPIYLKYKTSIIVTEKSKMIIDPRFGRVEYTSFPNYYYDKGEIQNLDKDIDIKKNDIIVFLNSFKRFAEKLEDDLFRTLDKEYYYCHRYKIAGKIT